MTVRNVFRNQLVRWGLAGFLLLVVFYVWMAHLSAERAPLEVSVVSPDYRPIARQVSASGSVMPMSEFQARASFPGMVDKVYVELGDKVQAGQMLITMKDPFAVSRVATANSALQSALLGQHDIKQQGSQGERINLLADLDRAQLSERQAQGSLETVKRLFQQGSASQAEVNAAQDRLHSAQTTLNDLTAQNSGRFGAAELRSATARVKDAQETLNAAKASFDNANIRSPVSGTVYSVSVLPYDFAPMGAELLRVADISRVQIRTYFDEPEVGELAAGQPVSIVWDARPGRTWHGHIRRAPVAAMPMGTRSVAECLISVDDSKSDLLPNTNVSVTVTLQKVANALTIPRESLHTVAGRTLVYRVVDGHLQETPVDVGIVTLARVQITKGLTTQDQVILNTVQEQLLAGSPKVRIVTGSEPHLRKSDLNGSGAMKRLFQGIFGSNTESQTR